MVSSASLPMLSLSTLTFHHSNERLRLLNGSSCSWWILPGRRCSHGTSPAVAAPRGYGVMHGWARVVSDWHTSVDNRAIAPSYHCKYEPYKMRRPQCVGWFWCSLVLWSRGPHEPKSNCPMSGGPMGLVGTYNS